MICSVSSTLTPARSRSRACVSGSIAPAEHSQHDDLVFATAIALWFACQPANKGTIGAVSQGRLF